MIWNLLTKLWPAGTSRDSNNNNNTIRNNSTPSAAAAKRLNRINCQSKSDNIQIQVTARRATSGSRREVITKLRMERQRSTKGPSFRMRISRRIRAGFMPVPQQDSDTEHVLDGGSSEAEGGTKQTDSAGLANAVKKDEVKKDKYVKKVAEMCRKEGKDSLGVGPEIRREGGSLRMRANDGGKYDLTVDSSVELGYSFRQKRRSFGSESEKRRGERFLRREIEKKKTVEESDDLEDSSDSSGSHVCDFSCPLITHGDCPNSRAAKGQHKAQRRSSFASPASRDTALTLVTSPSRRPAALASVSIDDIPGQEFQAGLPINSPGMLSTASMWSTSDLHSSNGALYKADADTSSRAGATSLSNVSETFSERMHELVRAFSNRTQRTKEKISQPPTPSSDSDNDAKSVISGPEETQAPRNIRLGSFLPMGSQASDAFSDENHDHFLGLWHCKFKTPKFLKNLRFPSTIEPHSKIYVSWLFLVSLAFLYNAVVIPLRGVFPYQTSENVHYWLITDYFCDVVYLLDIVLFKSRLRFTNDGVVECNRRETRKHYMQKLMFKFDIMSLIPLDLFYFIKSVGVNPWLRLPRVLKIQTYWEFYEKCDQASRSSAYAIRIIKTVTYMLFLIHVETCGYYAVSVYEGLGTNKWVYSGQGIAYIRCFYLATKTATSIGNNPTPTNQLEFSFMTLYWLSGVFVFALLIGQIRDIVEAAGMVKDNYRKKMDSCLWYMQSINLPKEMKDRVRMWFLYNWDQQKTIDERSLVRSLPKKLQADLAINVHFNTLSKVQLFQDCERNLLYDLVLKLRPILYLPGDYICKKGEVGKEMYIVSQGQVEVVGGEHNETVLATLHEGSVFGEISLLAMSGRGNRRTADVRSKGYTNVFTLSKHDFEMAMTEYPDAQAVLKKRAKKLLKANARMERQHKKVTAEEIIKTPPENPKLLQTVIQVMDPDSNFVKHLNPVVKKSHRNLKKLHSRSHSHRLSTSASNLHHLTPYRSHSFRLTSQPSSFSLSPSLNIDQMFGHEQDGFNTDDENEEPLYDDSSDDISLSEVLHDALAISSFDDDDDGDDELSIIEQNSNKPPNRNNSFTWNHTSSIRKDTNEGEKDEKKIGKKMSDAAEVTIKANDVTEQKCSKEGNFNGKMGDNSQLEGRKSSEGNLIVGQHDLKGLNSSRFTGETENKSNSSNNGSQAKTGNNITVNGSRNNGNTNLRTIDPHRTDTALNENEKDMQQTSLGSSKINCEKVLQNEEMVENCVRKQNWSEKVENKVAFQNVSDGHIVLNMSMNKLDNLLPTCLNLCDQNNVEVEVGGVSGRVRKLSVVTPPVSPRDKQNVPWTSIGAHSVKENNADLIMRCFTPTEATPMSPLPVLEPMKVKAVPDANKSTTKTTISPTFANGLEGCCGGGPLMDIPSDNRVTFAVEIHRQMNISSTTTDIYGHTETML